jgi:hypothetical protein
VPYSWLRKHIHTKFQFKGWVCPWSLHLPDRDLLIEFFYQDIFDLITRRNRSSVNGLVAVKASPGSMIANGTNSCTPTIARLSVMGAISPSPGWML